MVESSSGRATEFDIDGERVVWWWWEGWLDVVYLKQGATPNVWSGLVGLEVLMVKTDK